MAQCHKRPFVAQATLLAPTAGRRSSRRRRPWCTRSALPAGLPEMWRQAGGRGSSLRLGSGRAGIGRSEGPGPATCKLSTAAIASSQLKSSSGQKTGCNRLPNGRFSVIFFHEPGGCTWPASWGGIVIPLRSAKLCDDSESGTLVGRLPSPCIFHPEQLSPEDLHGTRPASALRQH